MVPTLHAFLRALSAPEYAFATLRNIEPLITIEGLPALRRTSRFAEAEVRLDGVTYLLSMPITASAVKQIETVLRPLQHLQHPALAPIRILPGELRWQDACGTEQRCDLVLQPLSGVELVEGFALLTPQERLQLIDRFETDLRTLGVAHNNLQAKNLRLHAGRLVAIRCFDLTFDPSAERDRTSLEALRVWAGCREENFASAQDETLHDTPFAAEWGICIGYLSEGLRRIEQEGLFGYVDRDGRCVIPPRYLSASDFHENRAVVQTPTGWGVIDREARYIIIPQYERIEYIAARSLFHLQQGGLWAWYDYLGRPLTDFCDEEQEAELMACIAG